jgi:hypothetical protein
VGRIVDRLIAQFGEQSVFMDVDNLPFGIDFRQHNQSATHFSDGGTRKRYPNPGFITVIRAFRKRLFNQLRSGRIAGVAGPLCFRNFCPAGFR